MRAHTRARKAREARAPVAAARLDRTSSAEKCLTLVALPLVIRNKYVMSSSGPEQYAPGRRDDVAHQDRAP